MAGYLALLFPHGELPSKRWRPVAYVAAAAISCLGLGVLLRDGTLDAPFDAVENPFGAGLGQLPEALAAA
jgi:hypothetical protein